MVQTQTAKRFVSKSGHWIGSVHKLVSSNNKLFILINGLPRDSITLHRNNGESHTSQGASLCDFWSKRNHDCNEEHECLESSYNSPVRGNVCSQSRSLPKGSYGHPLPSSLGFPCFSDPVPAIAGQLQPPH